MNPETKTCQNCRSTFVVDSEDFSFYEKVKVPPPTFCPKCRLLRRFIFRNDKTLYKRRCALCGKDIISIYHKDKPYVIYCQECWWSDKWDPTVYGKEYDFKKPFFEQFNELFHRTPIMANFVVNDKTMLNSPYNNMVSYLKNCYLLSDADHDENCAYGCEIEESKDCFDTNLVYKSELCYECVNCTGCYQTFFSVDCEACHNVWLSKNLANCNDCFGCVNLRGKQFHIFNQPYSKEEYHKELERLSTGSLSSLRELQKRFDALALQFPQKYLHGIRNTNSSGEYIYNSKNTRDSWIVSDCEDVRYSQYLVTPKTKDCYDYTQYGAGAELFYEDLQCGSQSYGIKFSWFVHEGSKNVEYSMQCVPATDVFGCVSLRNQRHCILNQQYTESEYKEFVPKIIAHMKEMPFKNAGKEYGYGEFFPESLSPFGYNETTAQQYFHLTKDEALARGYAWQDSEARNYGITMTAEKIPDGSKDIPDSILNEVLGCEHEGKCSEQCATAFKIIPQELQFLKRIGLPLPRLCPSCRHYGRLKKRNPPTLWPRACACSGSAGKEGTYANTAEHFHGAGSCPNKFETSYAPDRPEIIYCEPCYQAEVS